MTDKQCERLEKLLERLLERLDGVDRVLEQIDAEADEKSDGPTEDEGERICEFIDDLKEDGYKEVAKLLDKGTYYLEENYARIELEEISKEQADLIEKNLGRINPRWKRLFPDVRTLEINVRDRKDMKNDND